MPPIIPTLPVSTVPTPAGLWPEWDALARQIPALCILLDDLRAFMKIAPAPDAIWYERPQGIRERIRQILTRAQHDGIILPPNAELICVDRLLAELLCGPASVARWSALQ